MQGHNHKIIPVWAAEGIELEMAREDLGHPDRPGLWAELHGKCPQGVLVCKTCGRSLLFTATQDEGDGATAG
jgi:hypothetical protein